jgi:hypothetical protein
VVAIGVAEHRFEIPHRDVDHDGQRLSVAQRRDTSGDVTGGPFGVGHAAIRHFFAPIAVARARTSSCALTGTTATIGVPVPAMAHACDRAMECGRRAGR